MYKIKYNEKVFRFARDNKIVLSDILENQKEILEQFPYIHPFFSSHGVSNKYFRIAKIPNKNIKILYIVFENEKYIVIEDIVKSNSSTKLKR